MSKTGGQPQIHYRVVSCRLHAPTFPHGRSESHLTDPSDLISSACAERLQHSVPLHLDCCAAAQHHLWARTLSLAFVLCTVRHPRQKANFSHGESQQCFCTFANMKGREKLACKEREKANSCWLFSWLDWAVTRTWQSSLQSRRVVGRCSWGPEHLPATLQMLLFLSLMVLC